MNPEGRIIQILARASGIFVGTYFERRRAGSSRSTARRSTSPVYVGDPGAKGAKPGDKVALEMVRYPTPYLEGEGVITEVLGPKGQPGVDTLSIIRAFNIPDTFDDETLDDARGTGQGVLGERYRRPARPPRRAHRHDRPGDVPATSTTRSLSSATSGVTGAWGSTSPTSSHFVPPGSDLDKTARQRGTSVYLPDRVIPMLPEVLSNSLASLQAGRVRYTVSAFLEFNAEGIRTDARFARSRPSGSTTGSPTSKPWRS